MVATALIIATIEPPQTSVQNESDTQSTTYQEEWCSRDLRKSSVNFRDSFRGEGGSNLMNPPLPSNLDRGHYAGIDTINRTTVALAAQVVPCS